MDVLELLEEIDRLDEPYYKGYICKYDVQDIIRNHFLDVRKMVDGWIPVEEGLPEEGENDFYDMQLVTLEDGEVCLGVYINPEHEWWTRRQEGETLYTNKRNVVAWQPLPEHYKPKEKVKKRKNTQQEMGDFGRDK